MNRMRGGTVRPGNDFLFWGASSWRESRQKSPAQEQKRVLNNRTSKTKKRKKKEYGFTSTTQKLQRLPSRL